MSDNFIVRANWAWGKIKRHGDDEYRLGIGAESEDVGQVVLCDSGPLSEEELDPIFDFMALVSQCYFVQKQYLGFKELSKALVASLDLRADGSFALVEEGLLTSSAKADAYITAIASAGDLVLDAAEHYIEKTLGKEAAGFQRWKNLSHYLFDNDLGYALMCKLRNVTQHDKFMVNVVGVENRTNRAYLVFNLEHDYETLILGDGLRAALEGFRSARIKAGELPRLSVYKAVEAYRQNVAVLYQAFIETIDPIARSKARGLPIEILSDKGRCDCLVRTPRAADREVETREVMLLGGPDTVSDMGIMDDRRLRTLLEKRGALSLWDGVAR